MQKGFAVNTLFVLFIIANSALAQPSSFGFSLGGGIGTTVVSLPAYDTPDPAPGIAASDGPYALVELVYMNQFSPSIELQIALGAARYSGLLIFDWPDRPAEREELSSWAAHLSPRVALHALHLPGLPYFFVGPALRLHGPRPSEGLLLLKPLEGSVVFGIGIMLRLAGMRLRPEFSFDLSVTNRLLGAQTTEHLRALTGIRRDLIGLRLLLSR